MKKRSMLFNVLLMASALAFPAGAAAADRSLATSGAGGVFPPGTSFTGVDINGLQLGIGVEINPDGSGLGNFTAVLLGVSPLGTEQRITIEGVVAAGTHNAANVAVVSGTSTVDLGDGTLPALDVPFTATLTSDGNDQGTVGLVVSGFTELPNAALDTGSLSIRTVPID
jgi:hypothetical protein